MTETVAILVGLTLHALAGGFWAGRISTRVASIDDRLQRLERRFDS